MNGARGDRREQRKNRPDKGAKRFPPPCCGVVAAFVSLLLFPPARAHGQTDAIFPRISLVTQATGLAQPVQVTHAGDGSGILFVVEQGGRIRTIRNGSPDAAPFLDIASRVLAGGERGLLGLAFSPGYATNGRFYVNYTRNPDGATVVARYSATGNPRLADPASEEVLLVIAQPFANHNGGQIAFGPDGLLYIGMGDGGSGGDPQNNAQNPATLLGKMLRIDVESGAFPYAIPPSNPFAGTGGTRGEIWASGLRNPWRFSFDRLTGDLYIGDVGQASFEEVDFQPAGSGGGENYGWNVTEGNQCFGGSACDTARLVPPVAVYDHSQGCSVTGGTVYRGDAHPRMQGIYFYGDFCSGQIFGLAREGVTWQSAPLLDTTLSISSFGEDEAGNLYVADYAGGAVHRIVAENAAPTAPVLVSPADGQAGLPGTVVFRWNPSVDPDGDPVSYLFFLDTDPSFAGTIPVPVPGPAGGSPSTAGSGIPAPLPAAVLALAAIFGNRKRIAASAAVLVLAAGLLASTVPGCGGSGGGQAPAATGGVTHEVSGLAPDTDYYWKVAAEDGTTQAESTARSFSTGAP